MSDKRSENNSQTPPPAPQPWVSPEIVELPPLTDLTLQTGPAIPGGGSIGGGGGTVF